MVVFQLEAFLEGSVQLGYALVAVSLLPAPAYHYRQPGGAEAADSGRERGQHSDPVIRH
jgi:hypothetical protein